MKAGFTEDGFHGGEGACFNYFILKFHPVCIRPEV